MKSLVLCNSFNIPWSAPPQHTIKCLFFINSCDFPNASNYKIRPSSCLSIGDKVFHMHLGTHSVYKSNSKQSHIFFLCSSQNYNLKLKYGGMAFNISPTLPVLIHTFKKKLFKYSCENLLLCTHSDSIRYPLFIKIFIMTLNNSKQFKYKKSSRNMLL
jgi:hypothetical protein